MPTTIQPTRLLLVTNDDAVTAQCMAMSGRLKLTIRAVRSEGLAIDEFARFRPDVLAVDEALGRDPACSVIRHVRDTLCQDWLPIVALSDNDREHEAIAKRVAGHIDFEIRKPLSFAALKERNSALRRIIGLRRVSRSALDRVSEGVIVIDERAVVRSFNGAAETLFGWRAAEIVGRNVNVLMPPGHRERHDGYLGNYERTRKPQVIGIGRVEDAMRKDGTRFPMHLTVADISDGASRRFVGVIRDLTVYLQRDELQTLARHDSLTGLPNRAYVGEVLQACASHWQSAGCGAQAMYSVLFCDLDGFKAINDEHGHRAGDEVLQAVAKRLRNSVSEKDFVARLAGDEFLVVLRDVRSRATASAVANRVSATVSQPIMVGPLALRVGLSVGIASPDEEGLEPHQLLERADQRMYEAKKAKHAGGAARR